MRIREKSVPSRRASSTLVVFELVRWYHLPLMWWYLISARQVSFLRLSLRCSQHPWLLKHMQVGRIQRCTLEEQLYLRPSIASDLAFNSCERLYNANYADVGSIRRLIRLYRDERVYLAYKKGLIEELFYVHQLDLLFQKLAKAVGLENEILVIPSEMDMAWKHRSFRRVLPELCNFHLSRSGPRVPFWGEVVGACNTMFRKALWASYGLYSILLCGVRYGKALVLGRPLREWREYAVALRSPTREMANRVRGVDFLLDDHELRRDNTAFIPIARISMEHAKWFQQEGYCLADLNAAPPIADVARLVGYGLLAVLQTLISPEWITRVSAYLLSEFGTWTGFSSRYEIKHFVTYCDFGIRHIGRNVLLNRRGVTTWHYTDTANTAAAFSEEDGCSYRQEQWGYMMYDRFVSWSPWFSRFHQQHHHQMIGQYIDVGVIWAEHVRLFKEGVFRSDLVARLNAKGFKPEQKLVSVFDSSYHDETLTTYRDGIEFLRGIEHLVNDLPELFVIFKEKKPRSVLSFFSNDPAELQEMKNVLDRLDSHPRCYLPGYAVSASELIAFSDLVVCYPFTSTGIEALASSVMALYYDPTAKFRKTYYARIPGLVVHDYTHLRHRVDEILYRLRRDDYDRFFDRYVKGDLEPYMDGRAITRFRSLLAGASSAVGKQQLRERPNPMFT